MQSSGHFLACSRGIFSSGKTVNVYFVDVTKGLYLSLLPQKGWSPLQEAVPIFHLRGLTSRTLNLRSSISGRTVQIVLELNHDKDQQTVPKTVRIYAHIGLPLPGACLLHLSLSVSQRKRH